MISPTDISTSASRVLAQYDVSEAYLIGSFARGEQTPDSDIDLRLVCGAHVLWWVGDDINLSPKFLLELIGEFVKRAERHGVAAFRKSIEQDEERVYEAL